MDEMTDKMNDEDKKMTYEVRAVYEVKGEIDRWI